MNISICITVLNEEGSIAKLLDSLISQSKKAFDIVIVDGGSSDKTVEIIRHYQKRFGTIKLLVEKSSRARGRNLAIEMAKGEVIAMTDAGCIADKNWLENLIKPFETVNVDVVAGFYKMTGDSFFQKAESVYLGINPSNFGKEFLPSTRSIAFTKKIWEEVGGFPESIKGAAEDTVFNYRLIKSGAKISRVKDATVEWGMPTSISNFHLSIFNYAKGDIESKIWFFPGKCFASHNIKALLVIIRYLLAIVFAIYSLMFNTTLFVYLYICVFVYLIWSFRKVFLKFQDWRVALWGVVLQIVSDFGVMRGFVKGL